MTISVDWAQTKVIFIPKADMVELHPPPHEVRELDLNAFRLTLRDLEEDPDGRPWPMTHSHNTEESLGGLLFARQVKILAPYTVTFEDGQYRVNAVGANSNIADVQNFNQVSVSTFNSAGLVVVSGGGSSITKQDVRDAAALALSPGIIPEVGSQDACLDSIASAVMVLNDVSAEQVREQVDAGLVAYDATVPADLASLPEETADAVWDHHGSEETVLEILHQISTDAAAAVVHAEAAVDAAEVAAIAAGVAAENVIINTERIEAVATDVTVIRKIEEGDWEQVGNQLIYYDTDGTTPIEVWDLFDAAGNPSMINVVKRVRHV